MSVIADTIVVGAGLTGLTVARSLAAMGADVAVLDKGRGIGGRLATRRSGDLRFDHGAQYIRPRDAGFITFMAGLLGAGAAAPWPEAGAGAFVGQPGMSGLLRPLAEGLAVHVRLEVAGIRNDGGLWRMTDGDGAEIGRARQLVLAVPAPQARRLLAGHPFEARLADVEFAPCWTLMAAFEDEVPGLPDTRRDPEGDLGWIARDSARPGRAAAPSCWVAQAGESWSRANLELDRDEARDRMLALFAGAAEGALPEPVHAAAHRWRYARAARPLGEGCLHDAETGLTVAGDWCLGDRAEHGWLSARAALTAMGMDAPFPA